MIDARELRLNNYIFDLAGGVCQVRGYTKGGINITGDGWPAPQDAFAPIPLTEEWLEKFGFKKINHIHNGELWSHTTIKLNWYPNGMVELRGAAGWNRIEHAHTLQNLYFALTGTELTIKK